MNDELKQHPQPDLSNCYGTDVAVDDHPIFMFWIFFQQKLLGFAAE